MKKYFVCYERCFRVWNGKAYLADGREISCVSAYFEIHLHDKMTGREVFFRGDEKEKSDGREAIVEERNGLHRELNRSFICEYDKDSDTGYCLKQRWDGKNENISYQPEKECYAWIRGREDENPVCISYEEFCRILKQFPEAFDNGDNKPADSTAYAWRFPKADDAEDVSF